MPRTSTLWKFDFQVCRVSTPGKHLSTEMVGTKQVHPLLVGNLDQVWTTVHEPAQRVDWEQAKLTRQLRINLGLGNATLPAQWEPQLAKDDGYKAVAAVGNWREPRTTTTLSWRNGDVGRLFVTVADDKITNPDQAQAFRAFMTVRSDGATHMWKGATARRALVSEAGNFSAWT